MTPPVRARIPFFDQNVEHVPVSKLRYLNTSELLKTIEHPVLVYANGGPVAVLVSYESWGMLQGMLESGLGPILDKFPEVVAEVDGSEMEEGSGVEPHARRHP